MNLKFKVVIIDDECFAIDVPFFLLLFEFPKKNDKNLVVVVNGQKVNPSTTDGNESYKKNEKNIVVAINGVELNLLKDSKIFFCKSRERLVRLFDLYKSL